MMTSSNGNIFRVTGPLCGEFTGPGESPTQRTVTRSFDVFFDLRLNKRSSKQPWGWWFETLSWSLWRHCNVNASCIAAFILLPVFTLGNPFAHTGKNITRPFCYLGGKCLFNVQTEMRSWLQQLLFPEGMRCERALLWSKSHFSLHIKTKQQGHIVWFHKHKIKLKYV